MTLGNPVASAVISAEPLGYLLLIVVSVTYYKTYKHIKSQTANTYDISGMSQVVFQYCK